MHIPILHYIIPDIMSEVITKHFNIRVHKGSKERENEVKIGRRFDQKSISSHFANHLDTLVLLSNISWERFPIHSREYCNLGLLFLQGRFVGSNLWKSVWLSTSSHSSPLIPLSLSFLISEFYILPMEKTPSASSTNSKQPPQQGNLSPLTTPPPTPVKLHNNQPPPHHPRQVNHHPPTSYQMPPPLQSITTITPRPHHLLYPFLFFLCLVLPKSQPIH